MFIFSARCSEELCCSFDYSIVLIEFLVRFHRNRNAHQTVTYECANTLNVFLRIFNIEFNMFCVVKANRFHWNTDILAKLCKRFNILKWAEKNYCLLSKCNQSAIIIICQWKFLPRAELICLYLNTKTAVGCSCQGILSCYMDLRLKRNSTKIILLFAHIYPTVDENWIR